MTSPLTPKRFGARFCGGPSRWAGEEGLPDFSPTSSSFTGNLRRPGSRQGSRAGLAVRQLIALGPKGAVAHASWSAYSALGRCATDRVEQIPYHKAPAGPGIRTCICKCDMISRGKSKGSSSGWFPKTEGSSRSYIRRAPVPLLLCAMSTECSFAIVVIWCR